MEPLHLHPVDTRDYKLTILGVAGGGRPDVKYLGSGGTIWLLVETLAAIY